MTEPIIEVEDLSFDYPGFRALDRVSLTIKTGSVTALVGPNGAGKTTLLRCIAALESPLSGRVRVAGYNLYESPREVHRLMGYLSDSFGLYGNLTVAQGLEYAARSQGLAAAAVKPAVQTTAERMGLSSKLTSLASALSRGQRQRLGIGQAIIHSPRLLLLDEPASGLDPEARGSLAQVFRELQAQGMSLLVSSHILAELDEYSTDMLALNNGRVLEHRSLQHHRDPNLERILRLEFAEKAESALPWVAIQPKVRLIQADAQVLELGFSGSLLEQAALIAACVNAGLPLASLSVKTENLQQSYLKSLATERALASRTSL